MNSKKNLVKLETEITSSRNINGHVISKNHRSITHEEDEDDGLSVKKKQTLLRDNTRGAQTQADDMVLCDVNPIDRFKIIKTFPTTDVDAPTLR